MTESEDEQAGPDVPEPETELTLHQTIELMLAKSRDNTRFGGFLNRLEVIGEEGSASIDWDNPVDRTDFMQWLVTELQTLRTAVSIIALVVDGLRGSPAASTEPDGD